MCLGCTLLVWTSGCSRRGRPSTVPVGGRVTFAGGECPAVGCVFFLPADDQPSAAARPRSGWARFERDGRYRATTLVDGDGLLPGVYEVRIDCHAATETRGGHHDESGTSLVPAELSLPRLTVPGGGRGPVRHDIDVGSRHAAEADPAAEGGSRVHRE